MIKRRVSEAVWSSIIVLIRTYYCIKERIDKIVTCIKGAVSEW